MPTSRPTIYLIAGCNGAGKTTFAKEFLPNEVNCLRFYNADEIARGLSPLDPRQVASRPANFFCAKSTLLLTDRNFRRGKHTQRQDLRPDS
jgi:predicted ABC-type ATPase